MINKFFAWWSLYAVTAENYKEYEPHVKEAYLAGYNQAIEDAACVAENTEIEDGWESRNPELVISTNIRGML